ncbi:helix-turn-helix transcriptional regulator [Streptomyces olivochromogenes]|uniref:Transcriptional regulator n=1 Tax=Streptomyces olivochromogenes TaxID=1963 RepID=A0A250VQL1_STROL|nr:helix-turn-helix transcriptional regulator [Streptomyces olivochromogenes]KUN39808.1 XRE family transcriptional regulator [Streptomyces olivochromogenes]GAX56260.1 transcriptional regulator [Streptomyces olivochromogenes]
MARNVELSEFLRRSRARITPESAGLPERGAYRRVPGLRREEVAQLAGVSTDYYTRLEQGRQISPSAGVLESVAVALRLDAPERAHLFDLAGPKPDTARRSAPTVQRVRPGLRRFLDSFTDQAAFVLGRRTDVLATNHLARALLTDFEAMPARERNLTRWILLDEAAHARYPDWEQVAAEMTAILRLDAGRHSGDTRTAELVGELTMKSQHFRRWWAEHQVFDRSHGHKRYRHPVVGDLTIDYQAFTMPGENDQTLFLYLPAQDQASQDAWKLLASWSAQEPATRRDTSSHGNASPRTPHTQRLD